MVNFDSRWTGRHGIGRFSTELLNRLTRISPLSGPVTPTNPLDCLWLSWQMLWTRGFFFSPGYNSPLLGFQRYLFTVHDLNHVDLPYNSSLLKRAYYRQVLRRACRHSCRVLTVSEFSRQRIMEWASAPASQIVNVGNGVDPAFTPKAAPYTPGYPYLLSVSNRKLHKNEPRLLKSFAMSRLDPEIRLLFTGQPTKSLMQQINQLGLQQRIVFTGFIEESDLPSLYTGALALLFPSLYEGFGLPVVEAMACGTPVMTSNTTSLPEVAGQAAILVSPESTDEISNGIERIVLDVSLRETLRTRGLERAKLFSWNKVAARVQSVLDEEVAKYAKK
ncbi:glycosyltransferase family 4 protein [Photorhabdus sp. APURE]|uniref:glycosyltransferase family 4 protein n=1 Tax=Photorhabdus aballayi TaxID=2991723 RepID=UPI00223D3E50|nr:glycosyltransferase family 1 protein [Photorhabdus aballayi]MCW7548265.1 glycosyltransferase family 4 protein [Photorhabdus aballayi]